MASIELLQAAGGNEEVTTFRRQRHALLCFPNCLMLLVAYESGRRIPSERNCGTAMSKTMHGPLVHSPADAKTSIMTVSDCRFKHDPIDRDKSLPNSQKLQNC